MRYRVTIRDENLQLRGYVDGEDALRRVANAVAPSMVIASPAADDYNPFSDVSVVDTIKDMAEDAQAIADTNEEPREGFLWAKDILRVIAKLRATPLPERKPQ